MCPTEPDGRDALQGAFARLGEQSRYQRFMSAITERGIGDHMAGVLRVVAGGTVELATPPWGLLAHEG